MCSISARDGAYLFGIERDHETGAGLHCMCSHKQKAGLACMSRDGFAGQTRAAGGVMITRPTELDGAGVQSCSLVGGRGDVAVGSRVVRAGRGCADVRATCAVLGSEFARGNEYRRLHHRRSAGRGGQSRYATLRHPLTTDYKCFQMMLPTSHPDSYPAGRRPLRARVSLCWCSMPLSTASARRWAWLWWDGWRRRATSRGC